MKDDAYHILDDAIASLNSLTHEAARRGDYEHATWMSLVEEALVVFVEDHLEAEMDRLAEKRWERSMTRFHESGPIAATPSERAKMQEMRR